jgi:C_GCAxxG_C_C family probable redox protein
MTGAFGGGFHVGDVCGALSGSACVISSKYIETRAHETTHLKPIMLNLVRAFQNHFSSRLCCQIKAKHYSQEVHCLNTVKATAEILEQVLTEYEKSH